VTRNHSTISSCANPFNTVKSLDTQKPATTRLWRLPPPKMQERCQPPFAEFPNDFVSARPFRPQTWANHQRVITSPQNVERTPITGLDTA
jgi:hypothetical protein